MAKKLTAKQKRMRKEAEKKQRAAYQAGKIPAGKSKKPKSQNVPRGTNAERNAARIAERRTAAETAKLSKSDLSAEIVALWDKAYKRYRRLMEQGTPTAATAIYEQNFAGMNPYKNNANTNRAMAAQLKTWLKRKDTRATKAKKVQTKTLEYVRKHGLPNMKKDELTKFFELFEKYLDWTGGIPAGFVQYLEHFAKAYSKYRENPDENMEKIFEDALNRMREAYADNYKPSDFAANPLEI